MTTKPNDPNECNYNWRESDPGLWTCEPGAHCKLQLFTHSGGTKLAQAKLRVYVLLSEPMASADPFKTGWVLVCEEQVPPRELDPGVSLSPIECAEISFWDWLRTLGASTLP